MKYLGIAALIFLSACGADESGTVDGVFVSFAQDESYQVARFYDDGTVMTVSVGSEDKVSSKEGFAQSWQNIGKWFNRENTKGNHSAGTYVCEASVISFSSTSSSGQVDYEGVVKDGKLTLNIHSLINGHKTDSVIYEKMDVAEISFNLAE